MYVLDAFVAIQAFDIYHVYSQSHPPTPTLLSIFTRERVINPCTHDVSLRQFYIKKVTRWYTDSKYSLLETCDHGYSVLPCWLKISLI